MRQWAVGEIKKRLLLPSAYFLASFSTHVMRSLTTKRSALPVMSEFDPAGLGVARADERCVDRNDGDRGYEPHGNDHPSLLSATGNIAADKRYVGRRRAPAKCSENAAKLTCSRLTQPTTPRERGGEDKVGRTFYAEQNREPHVGHGEPRIALTIRPK